MPKFHGDNLVFYLLWSSLTGEGSGAYCGNAMQHCDKFTIRPFVYYDRLGLICSSCLAIFFVLTGELIVAQFVVSLEHSSGQYVKFQVFKLDSHVSLLLHHSGMGLWLCSYSLSTFIQTSHVQNEVALWDGPIITGRKRWRWHS